ncbi:MAG: class I SAM-dependent methyltransferase [Candidatus Thiodiazotropha sp.]
MDSLIVQEYDSLRQQLDFNQGIPFTPHWSAGADFIQIIVDACFDLKPSLILECSSGLTTLMLARCCQINGNGRIISLENGEEYAQNTRKYIEQYGLQAYSSIIHAPLTSVTFDQVEYQWYTTTQIPEDTIDMLVIDGPSGFIGKNARYPAIPIAYPNLSHGSQVFLDDAGRQDEQEIIALWLAKYSGLSHEYRKTTRGCSVLTVDKKA